MLSCYKYDSERLLSQDNWYIFDVCDYSSYHYVIFDNSSKSDVQTLGAIPRVVLKSSNTRIFCIWLVVYTVGSNNTTIRNNDTCWRLYFCRSVWSDQRVLFVRRLDMALSPNRSRRNFLYRSILHEKFSSEEPCETAPNFRCNR